MNDQGIEKQSVAIRNKGGNPAWVKGVSGNPHGRPPAPEIEELRQAIREVRKHNGNRSIIHHFVRRAYYNDAVLIALIKKLIPDRISKDLNLDDDLKEIIGSRVQINFIGCSPENGNADRLQDSSEVS